MVISYLLDGKFPKTEIDLPLRVHTINGYFLPLFLASKQANRSKIDRENRPKKSIHRMGLICKYKVMYL